MIADAIAAHGPVTGASGPLHGPSRITHADGHCHEVHAPPSLVLATDALVRVTAERDAALAHASNLAAVVERVADRLTAEDGAEVAALVARAARERQTEREALARAEAERDEAMRKLAAELNPQFLCDDMRDVSVRLHLGPCGTSHEIDVRIDDLLAAERERDALRAAVARLHAARGDSYLDRLVSVEEAAFADLLALLPPEDA